MRKFMNWWLAFQKRHCTDIIATVLILSECDAIQFRFSLPVVGGDESKDFALAYNCSIDGLETDIFKYEAKLVEVVESLRSRVNQMQVKEV